MLVKEANGPSCDGRTVGAKQIGMPATVYLTNRPFCVCQLMPGYSWDILMKYDQ